jgi:hypothetical protein
MGPMLPPEVLVSELGGVRYSLPPRQLGAYRYVGLALLIPGLMLCAIPGYAAWRIGEAMLQGAGEHVILWLGAFTIGMFCFSLGWALARTGLFVLAGQSEIELRDGVLYSRERCGPLRWTWNRPVKDLKRFFVSEGLEPLNFFGKMTIGPLDSLCVITPEWTPAVGGQPTKSMWLAPGYPRPWLLAIAGDLARRCKLAAVASDSTTPTHKDISLTPIAVVQREPDFSDFEELSEQPVGSRITAVQSGDSLRVIIPPLMLRNGPGWLWAGLFLCFFAFAVGTKFFEPAADRDMPLWFNVALFAATGIGGVAFLAGQAHLSLQRVELDVEGQALSVRQSSVLGTKEWQWSREQLADVFVLHHPDSDGPDHWEMQIQPQPGGGEDLRLLAYRDAAELRWLATLLRQTLRCPCQSPYSPPDGLVVSSPRHVLRRSELCGPVTAFPLPRSPEAGDGGCG